jgi:hypothetical protein
MKASDPVVMLVPSIATRTVAKATLPMRKTQHPSCIRDRNVVTFLSSRGTGDPLIGIEGRH